MKRFYYRLPGTAPVKVLLIVMIVVIVLVVLGVLFEWAGGILDDGGAIG